jgi:hypothetical protein
MTPAEIAKKLTPAQPDIMFSDAFAVVQSAILRSLDQVPEPGWCLGLHGLQVRTDFPKEFIRGGVAVLRAEGLVSHHIGLWSEDGEPVGAGYALTDLGRAVLAELDGVS